MKRPLYKRKRFWGVIIIAIFFMGLTLSNYLKYIDNRYVGEVEAITSTGIVIIDRKVGQKSVQILDDTRFINSDSKDNPIQIGDNIIVVSKIHDNKVAARSVRVLIKNKLK